MEPVTAAAPAQPETPTPTISAAFDAASKGDFLAFDTAHKATRAGTPLPAVTKPAAATETPDPAAVAQSERKVSNRQQQINDYERRIAEQNERIARLESAQRPPAAPRSEKEPAAPAQAETKEPAYKRYLALPDAPKLADFDSVEEHAAAMAVFIDDTRHSERTTAAEQDKQKAAEQQDFDTRVTSYSDRLAKAKAADPEIGTKIAPELLAARPISGYPQDKQGQYLDPETGQPMRFTFAHLVAEVGFRYAEHPAALYAHLTAHPEEATRIGGLSSNDAVIELRALDRQLAATLPAAEKTVAPAPSTITAAPPPPPTLTGSGATTDPQAAALKRGDFNAFHQAETEKRRARLVRA